MNQGALVNLILGGVIALLPLYLRISTVDFSRTSKDNLLVAILTVLMVLMPKPARRTPWHLWAIFLYTVPATILNQWNVISVNVMFQTFYFVAGISFFIAYYQRHDRGTISFILNGMSIGCIIQSLVAIPEYFNYSIYQSVVTAMTDSTYWHLHDHGSVGTLSNSNLLGSYLALTGVSLFRPKWWMALFLAVPALLLSNSAMGVCSFLAGGLYFINSRFNFIPRAWCYWASALAMLAAFVYGLGGADSGRFDAWRTLFKRVDLQHFIMGRGPGWFPDQRIMLANETILLQEHNAFLTAFNFFGVAGAIVAAPLVIRFICKRDESKVIGSVLFVAFCNSFGHFTLHQSTVAIIIIVMAGIGLAEGYNYELDLER